MPEKTRRLGQRRSSNHHTDQAIACRLDMIEPLECRLMLAADLVISEFMAANSNTIQDKDGDRSDWIEIYNRGDAAANLEGWYLTDSAAALTQWRFPALTIPANGYVLVWASGKDLATAGKELHTNFKLSADGEYLALVQPDGKVKFDYGPEYPPQAQDVSFGLDTEAGGRHLLSGGAPARAIVPDATADAAIGTSWRQPSFDDSQWLSGKTGVGFEQGSGYEEMIGLNLSERMYTINSTAYIRVPFNVDDPEQIQALTLRMKYDDGFVAFINGAQVAQAESPSPLLWSSSAESDHPDDQSREFVNFSISAYAGLLQPGQNILAIHGLNRTNNSSDFLIVPELVTGGLTRAESDEVQSFTSSTPGGPNRPAVPTNLFKPMFSEKGRTFTGSLTVALTTDSPQGQIRYTLDRSIPSASSPLYTGPIIITSTTVVRARVFQPGMAAGPVVSESYFCLDSSVQNFDSNLPLIVVDTFGAGLNDRALTPAAAYIIDTADGTGRARMLDSADFAGRVGVRLRGQTSQDFPKRPYALETWDENNDDMSVSILGMPKESDWILYNPYSEKSLMQNYLAYQWSNRMGEYAVRTQYVELFINTDGGSRISYSSDYAGVYIFMEKIKIDNDRVDIAPMTPADNAGDAVTGGYIFKKDKYDAGETGFYTNSGQGLLFVEPSESEITPQQRSYLLNYINEFEAVLYGPNFRDPVNGYAKYIDVDSWIDHHIMVEMTKNIDGFRLSTYWHKDRNGKIAMGPIWDYNLSLGNADYLTGNSPTGWYSSQLSDWDYPYWRRLFQDPDFQQRCIDRWEELRQNEFSTSRLMSDIDSLVTLLSDGNGNYPVGSNPTQPSNNPVVRNFKKWRILGTYVWPNGTVNNAWIDDVNSLKNFLKLRTEWIDRQYIAAPLLSHQSGRMPASFELAITAPSNTKIYYTTDGSDPRLSGGAISPSAILYAGPITLDRNIRVRARAFRNNSWSGITDAAYAIDNGLRITEVMYHPADASPGSGFSDDDYEYVELKNTGSKPIDLAGYRFSNGIDYVFDPVSPKVLAPGQYLVLVSNAQAFAQRYPGVAYGGVYTRTHLDNIGEEIELLDPIGAPIHEFTYGDSTAWPGRADGSGSSLEIIDPNGGYDDPHNWRASIDINGSPGAAGSPAEGIVINEVLSNTDSGLVDAIELHNITDHPIDISGWYLSDSYRNLRKFQIPGDTRIPAGGYIVFDEGDFNPTPQSPGPNDFALDGTHGDDLWLVRADAQGNLLAFADSVHYDAALSGQSLGRWPDGSGRLFPMVSRTFGDANSGPVQGSVIISEVMYHHPSGDEDLEYIELYNTTDSLISLGGWRLAKGVELTLPQGLVIESHGSIVVVPFNLTDPAKVSMFRKTYGIDSSVQLVGGYTGHLDNYGEVIRLDRPDAPPPGEPTYTPRVIVDEVDYRPTSPWPSAADAGGAALVRYNALSYGNDVLSWVAESPTPGSTLFANAIVRGTAGDDTFYLQLDPSGQILQIFRNTSPDGTPTFARPLDSVLSLIFFGLEGDDQLIIDLTRGNPIPTTPLLWDGGFENSSGDLVSIIGDLSTIGTYTPDALNTGSGTISIAGRTIAFSATESALASDFSRLDLVTPNSADALTIDRPAAGKHRVRGTSGGVALTPLIISNIDILGLDAASHDGAAGDDSISISYSAVPAAGLGRLSIDTGSGSNSLQVNSGTYTIEAVHGVGLTMNVNLSSVVTLAASQRLAALNIAGNSRLIVAAGGDKVLRLGGLSIGSDAMLDLNDNDLIVDSDAVNKNALLGILSGLIGKGRNGGTWTGRGITSSTAAADANRMTGLGILLNDRGTGKPLVSSFAGQAVSANSILIGYTYSGDADLNGRVDADDFFRIDQGLLRNQANWRNGDFDYSGAVDADDYALIDRAFLDQGSVLAAAAAEQTAAPKAQTASFSTKRIVQKAKHRKMPAKKHKAAADKRP